MEHTVCYIQYGPCLLPHIIWTKLTITYGRYNAADFTTTIRLNKKYHEHS